MQIEIERWLENFGSGRKPDEYDAKKLATIAGIQVPHSIKVKSGDKLDIDNISFPCVIKLCSPDVLHKTDVEGVILNNNKKNFFENLSALQLRFPKKDIIIETQVAFSGPEIIIGVIKDAILGNAVMVGAGGTFTEIYNDTAFRLVPCSVLDAMEMIEELKISPVFDDFRGIRIDKKALAKTVSHVSRLAEGMGDRLNQLDINPIVYAGDQWTALDVKIILDHPS